MKAFLVDAGQRRNNSSRIVKQSNVYTFSRNYYTAFFTCVLKWDILLYKILTLVNIIWLYAITYTINTTAFCLHLKGLK